MYDGGISLFAANAVGVVFVRPVSTPGGSFTVVSGLETLSPQQDQKRKRIAVGICVLATVLTFISLHFGQRSWLALMLLGGVWHTTGDWLGGRLWLLHKTLRQIYQSTRASGGGIFWLPPLARTMSWGGMILMIAGFPSCAFGP